MTFTKAAVVSAVALLVVSACAKDAPAEAFVSDYATWIALPDEEAQRQSAIALVDKWTGKRVRWTALALAGLCVKKAEPPVVQSCAINPFPRGGDNAEAAGNLGGVFPLYRFDAPTLAALKRACAGLDRCVVDIEAEIVMLRLDPDEPLALTLEARAVHGGRAPSTDDKWARAEPPGAAAKRPPPIVGRTAPSSPPFRAVALPQPPPVF